MKELIEDYKRRLGTAETMLKEFKSNGSEHDIRKQERLTTKASEYRTVIAEMERVINSHENAIKQMLELGLIRKVEKPSVICLTKEEVETFMNDISTGTGAWSDTSHKILKFIDIDSTQGT
jgi:hypothetical protein